MKTKKMILVLLVIFCFIPQLLIVKATNQAVDLEIWYIEPDETDDTFLSLINDFEQSEGVTVTATQVSPEVAKERYKSAYLNGTAPDIVQGLARWIPELVTNGMLHSVNESSFLVEYMPKAKRAVSYYEIIADVIQADSILYYGFPQRVDTQAFLYSRASAETMGATIPKADANWDITEFKTAITKLNDQSDPANKKYGFSFQNMSGGAEALFYGNNGKQFSNYTVDRAHIEIETSYSIEALQFMYDIVQTFRITPEYGDQGSENTYEKFANDGTVASTFDYATYIKKYLAGTQFSNESDIGIGPLPMEDNGTGAPLEVITLMINSASSTNEKSTAIELAQYLSSEEALISNAKSEYLLPSVWSVFDHTDLTDNQIIQAYKPILKSAREIPLTKYWESLQTGFGIEVGEMLNGDQNGTIAARAIGIRWSFMLPSAVSVDPIPPIGDEPATTTTKSSPVGEFTVVILSLGFGIVIRKKRR